MILFILSLVVLFVIYKTHKSNNDVKINKKVLTPEECSTIINLSNQYEYGQFREEVDGKPAYEIDIYDTEKEGIILNKTLWEVCKKIYDKHLKSEFKSPEYVFLRRYTPEERVELPIHLDSTNVTVLFLLSDTRDFSGGELFIFDKKFTQKHKYIGDKSLRMKNEFIKNIKKLPILKYGQGDTVTYSGKEHLHGVLPVTSGTRYTLSFFFE